MRIRQYIKRLATLALMAALLAPLQEVWGQAVKGDKYESSYGSGSNVVSTSIKTIQHKAAKWYTMRSGSNFVDTFDNEHPTFDDEHPTFENAGVDIQSAHTYVDTLYVKKGSQVTLWLPTLHRSKQYNSTQYYQRWYNYLTEGTFATGLTGDNNVNDILTPKSGIVYRFQNGYVGGSWMNNIMYGANFYYPKDDEYTGYKGLNNGSANNSYYIVACDVSGYTDFDQTTYTEPTLGLRVLYYIVGIDDTWGTNKYENQYERLNKADYKNGGNKYLEEYEITFPCDHIGDWTNELVSIARQAQFYRIPGDNAKDKLTARLEGTTIFKLVNNGVKDYDTNTANGDGTLTLGDDSRAIFFRKKEGNNNQAPWSVPDGTTATILVTKTVGSTTYNIARFKLTFKKNIRLLTQHQIARLDEARANNTTITGEGGWFDESYLYRTPAYLNENYILLTSRTFDYDSNVTGETHQGEYYPYPLAWDFSSYAFYDGSKKDKGENGFEGFTMTEDAYELQPFVEWGSYAIVNDYMGYGDKVGSPKKPTNEALGGRNKDGYFLYVDASALPGKLVTLPFTQNLCAGSELLVSAWVKSAGENNENTDDAAMLFSIYGIDGDGNRTLIHAQTTGQIRRTTNFKRTDGEYTDANGYGSGQNDWYQVFLSFLNDDVEKLADFVEYEVQIDNNSGSTSGGDFYLDEIKVYVAKPNAKVEQLAVSCEERTLMNIQLAWTRLMARIGNVPDPGTKYSQGIDFCFIDSVAYEVYRRKNPGADWTEAVNASLVNIGNVTDYDSQFATLYYDLDYDENNPYKDTDDDGAVLASENRVSSDSEPVKYGFYRIDTDTPEEMALSVDIYTALKQNRRYMILMKDHTSDGDVSEIGLYGEPEKVCSIVTSFEVDGRNHIIMNGQVVDPTKTDTYCIGQAFTFSVRLTYYDEAENDYVPYEGTVYFDWFFGNTMQENGLTLFESPNENGVSLEEALHAFRTHYPEEEATEDEKGNMSINVELKVGEGVQTPFTQNHKNIIEDYLNRKIDAAGLNKQLVLRKSELGIRLLEDGLDLAVAPIPVIGVDIALCFAPSFLTLEPNGLAPVVLPGFENMSYTDYDSDVERTDYYPAMRIGLAQIMASSADNPIKVNLRGAKFAFDSGATDKPSNYKPNHIGLMPKEKELYLISSNDPALHDLLNPTDGEYDRHQYSIGKVVSFYAKPYGGSGPLPDNHMDIYFDLTNPMSGLENNDATTAIEEQVFTPREGYEYRFGVHFEEHEAHTGQSEEDYVATPGSCYNYMEITMKVVPEYLVWQGKVDADGKIDNWNEDSVWKRISSDKINKSEDDQSDYFMNRNNQNENGYVPMLFTKVIIPENSQVALHSAGFTGSPDKYRNMVWKTDRPEYIKQPTKVNIPEDASVGMTEGHPIHYDMMVFTDEQGNMSTKPFRVNLCNEIHFEPGAELVNAEYLLYNKAWVDYKLDGSRWYTLASPLKDVVAGDFYTDSSTGKEGSEYFKDIKFNTEDDDNIESNSRFNPSVYQRAWKGNATLVEGLVDDVAINGDDNTTAVKGNWSALYNDVAEPYTPGTGFSLKVQDLASADNKALFRLPKADTEYYYYSHDGKQGQDKEEDISKTDAHRLETDRIMNRKVGENATLYTSFTVPLADEHGDYYLVGNPFMAHLDMKKFFDETNGNGSVLEKKYWLVTNDNQSAAVGTEDGSWVEVGDNSTAKIAPLQSFFVQKKAGASSNDIKFTQDMQTLGGTGDGLRSANALTITATTTDGRTSRAAVAYSGMASDDYQSSEDAELFLDSNLGNVPMVYTVAGTMATSINVRQNCELVPLGVYGTDDEPVTLRFDQVDAFSGVKLYDAQTKRYTTLTEGSEVSVSTNDSGRYYLTGGLATGSEAIRTVDDISIYSVRPGEIVATSAGSSLRSVRVYGIGGELVTQQSLANQSVYRLRVPGNAIYVVYAEDMDGIIRNVKLRVR